MSVSAIPAAIDYLISLAGQAKTALGLSTIIADGWPDEIGLSMFGLGADSPPDVVNGIQAEGDTIFKDLGAKAVDESFAIPCYIYDASGGTNQKACRDAVFALWGAFFPLFRADLSLGGALANGNNYARISAISIEGPKSKEEAADGRYCLLKFTVFCQNRY